MSLMTYVVRFSDKTLWCKKVHKKIEFSELQSIGFLKNEKKFKEFLYSKYVPSNSVSEKDHDDYDNENALFAPYCYGLVFIDFVENKIYSYNDYSGFLIFHAANLVFSYIIDNERGQEFIDSVIVKVTRILKAKIENKTLDDEYLSIERYVYSNFGYFAILIDAANNGQQLAYKSDDEIVDLLNKEKKDAKTLLFEVIEKYKNIYGEDDGFYMDEVSVVLEGWDIISKSGGDDIKELYEILKSKISFTDVENKIWNDFIKNYEK